MTSPYVSHGTPRKYYIIQTKSESPIRCTCNKNVDSNASLFVSISQGKGKGKVKIPPGMVKIETNSKNVTMNGGHMNINIPDINIDLNQYQGQPKKGGPRNMQVRKYSSERKQRNL